MIVKCIPPEDHSNFYPKRKNYGFRNKKVRAKIFKRDNYACLLCGKKDRLSIDHIVPLSKDGTNRQSNLQTLCEKCNSLKGDTTADYRRESKYKTIYGYNDILKVLDKVIVKHTGHKAVVSEVVGKPKVLHCTCYHLNPPDPAWEPNWYFRHELEVKN